MIITEDLLIDMGKMAELQFSNEEIALIVEMDPAEMNLHMEDVTCDIYKRVMAGRLRAEAELMQVITKLSKQGSSPAQSMLLKRIKDRERKDWMER